MLHNGHTHDTAQENEIKTSHGRIHDTNSSGVPARGASVPLAEILDQIPLTYSPVTKQLHLSYNRHGAVGDGAEKLPPNPDQKTEIDNLTPRKNLEDYESSKCTSEGDDLSVQCDSECGTSQDYDGYLCDEISRGISGLLEADISSLSSSASNQLDERLVDGSDEKPKRRGIGSFFSKNVFTWKGRENTNSSTNNSGIITNGLPSWLMFGKSSSDIHDDNQTDSENNSACSIPRKPYMPDSPTSVRSASSSTSFGISTSSNVKCNSSKKFQDVVASSSALIQLERPSSLPAKDSKEDAKHRLEYSQMIEAAKKREYKEAKQKKRQQLQQMKQEDRLAAATRIWTNEVLPDWESLTGEYLNLLEIQAELQIIKLRLQSKAFLLNNSQKIFKALTKIYKFAVEECFFQTVDRKGCRRIRDLWWQGLPPCIRGKVWQLAIGNELNLTHQLYGICVSRAQELLKAVSSSSSCDSLSEHDNPDRESSVELIQLDISRTFPQLCIFQKGGPYYDILHSLLGAYACYRPDVGYVQGMSFIAAVLILNMEEADAFVCFANLLNRPCHMAFFRLEETSMRTFYRMFDQFFSENLPRLHAHFVSVNLTADLYLLDWIYTVFAKAMPLDVACRVWDVFLRDGEEFLFRTALGVLHLYQQELISVDFIQGAQFLTRLPEDLSSDKLFRSIEVIRMQRYAEVLSAARTSVSLSSSENL